MKKLIYSIAVFALLISCDNNTPDFNNNLDGSYEVSAEVLLANAQKELADQMTTSSVNLNPFRYFTQYWSQTTYNDESRYRLNFRNVPDNHWNNLYRNVLGNLESAKDIISAETGDAAVKQNKLAIIEILQVYTFQVLVDSFGDIPYSEALDVDNKLPKYDDDAVIYPDLIARLNVALAQLDDSATSFDTGDILYEGNIGGWRIFANNLKLKLGINISDANPTSAQTTVQEAFAGGLTLVNADNSTFQYPGSAPNYNPIYADLVASNRNDYVASETLVDEMLGLNDPRIDEYFIPTSSGHVGGENGAMNTPFTSFSQIGERFRVAGLPAELFEATEINFYLAEAAARGFAVGNTPEFYYEAAVRASFEYYGLSTTQATAYLAQPSVAYATAPGDWKAKIGKQSWIAFFNRPFEGWNTIRRLDQPVLIPASNAVAAADGEIPKRLTYPINEQTVNTTNYQNAVSAIGEDRLKIHVFWDVN